MNVRKNVRNLSPDEKSAFVAAIIALRSAPSRLGLSGSGAPTNRYDDYVWIHDRARALAHNGPAFCSWHREFIRQFELDLRDVSGDDTLRLPYWDWTQDRTPSDPGWPFTDDLLGELGTSDSDSSITGSSAFATWAVNVRDNETGSQLKRRGGPEEFDLPPAANARFAMGLTDFDVVPFNVNPATLTQAEFQTHALSCFRKFLEWALHNGPHPWVGRLAQDDEGNDVDIDLIGSMTFQASPNDPVFFLHHCNIDRLWGVWQQRYGVPDFLPDSGADTGHNSGDPLYFFDTSTELATWITPNRTSDDVNDHRSIGPWYDTDLPRITLVSPSVSFGDVPEGLTTHRPIQLTLQSPRQVRFRIVSFTGTGSFSAAQAETPIGPTDTDVAQPAQVYVQYTADGTLGVPQGGTAILEAWVTDDEGYYTGVVGGNYRVATFPIDFTARTEARAQTAIALVLDRSGSMGWAAGGTLTRNDLLVEALQVFGDVLEPTEGLSMTTFDELIDRPFDVLPMTPTAGGNALGTALTDGSLTPRGSTAIGLGMIDAADALQDEIASSGTPYTRHAMVVFTDGNENAGPSVTDSPVTTAVAPFADSIYAIGLGRAEDVSESTLGAIATYMQVTGDMSASQRRFRLTKYFGQVLADAIGADIVADPEGALPLGVEHTIPFQIASTELTFDLVVASPYAPLLEVKLIAPGGQVIEAGATGPNVSIDVNLRDVVIRVALPALPSKPEASHAGTWKAVLSISPERLKKLLSIDRIDPKMSERMEASSGWPGSSDYWNELRERGAVPYVAWVQTRSNLKFEAEAHRTGLLRGSTLELVARLKQYDVPLSDSAKVDVEITTPSGARRTLALKADWQGTFRGQFVGVDAGTYDCRFVAGGRTREGEPFQREAQRTVSLYRVPPERTAPDNPTRPELCDLVSCALGDRGIRKWLESNDIDTERLMRCIDEKCGPNPTPDRKRRLSPSRKTAPTATTLADLLRVAGSPVLEVERAEAPDPGKVKEAITPHDGPRAFMPNLAFDGKTIRLLNKPMDMGKKASPKAKATSTRKKKPKK